jgi:N-acyl-D-amino-acid deacylase
MPLRYFIPAMFALLLLQACSRQDDPGSGTEESWVLVNARIVDGTGAPSFSGSVRIRGGRIIQLGQLEPRQDERVVDAMGKVLAPGFIDTHSHADDDIFDVPDALSATSQGITTVVVGQDGVSDGPVKEFFARLEQQPAAINVAAFTGHGSLRSKAMGQDYRRHANDDEIKNMAAWLQQDMAAGSLGLSSGLEYDPGIYSSTEELLALARVAAAAGGRYISHVRSEDRWFEDALEEIIQLGKDTGMPVQISHFKLAMKRLWGKAPEVLARLEQAREQGVNITADVYPYEYWQSDLMVLLPGRDPADRQAVEMALDQIAPPEGMWFTRFAPRPEYVGKTLVEVAALRKTDPVSAFMALTTESQAWTQRTGEPGDSIIGTSMLESDIQLLLGWPHSNLCTDGGLVDLHPRARGSYPRVLGRYVREQNLMSLEQAVYKMSGLAAEHMGFTDRGVIRERAVADLVLFDPDRVADRATPQAPELLSEGILGVWVNGTQVLAHGRPTGARPGQVIRRQVP